MSKKLLDMKAGELLHAFGTGGHKPGSGSAAAHIGSLAGQLTCNVIDLTEKYKKRRQHYLSHIGKLRAHAKLLRETIIPRLDEFTEADSIQFDKVIAARKARDDERDPKLKEIKAGIVHDEERKATELPLVIARYCYNVGKMAADVFDYGFVGAQGESVEGIVFAASSMLSCLAIVELNLHKIPVDAWTEKIRKQKEKLYTQQAELESIGKERQQLLKQEADEVYEYEKSRERFRAGNLETTIKTDQQLEALVSDLQNLVWKYRTKIWKKDGEEIDNYIQVLKPQDILTRVLGYSYIQRDTLGRHYEGDDVFEVAGLIDKRAKKVEVSKQFSPETIRFTLAHELGHALLHNGTVLHRDRGVDGSHVNRNATERQADKFAALLLMPTKLVRAVFEEIFETAKLPINENSVFQLGVGSIYEFRKKCINLRGFAREIATAKRYGGKRVTPLHAIFGVSVETMAIRLEELDMLRFD